MESQIMQEVVKTGLAGLIIVIIVAPFFKWMKDKIDEKDEEIKDLITNHLASDAKLKRELIQILGEVKVHIKKTNGNHHG